MFKYKVDIMQELKNAGYNTTRIRKEKIFTESTLTRIRNGGNINIETFSKICFLTGLSPSDVIEICDNVEN